MLKNIAVFDTPSWLLKDQEWIREAIRIQERFRVPEMAEIAGLMSQIKTLPVPEGFADLIKETSHIQRAMESMRAPWLGVQEQMRSLASFAELQGIGQALGKVPAFDDSLAAALRHGLGDWRDSISWKSEVFTNANVRSDLYVSLGFNKALTDFPGPAFKESLEIAGLRSASPALVGLYGPPMPAIEEEEDGLVQPHTAYDWLFRFETELRAFIDREMTRVFGREWPKHRLDNGVYDQWQEKKKKAEQGGGEVRPVIAYADFTDYVRVICRKDNWREVFAGVFQRAESVFSKAISDTD